MKTADAWIEKAMARVAQEIVYCNCAREGSYRRCEHIPLQAVLLRELGPLISAGEAMRNDADEDYWQPWDFAKRRLLEGSGQ